MPFQSKAQQHWMFANHPEMAKEWATNTNFAALPDKKDTAACEESNQAIIRLRDKLKQQREARESNQAILRLRDKLKQQREARESNQAILRLRDKLRQQREIKEANQAAVNFRDIIKHGMFKLRLKQAMFKLRLKQVMIRVRDERKRRKAAKEAALKSVAKAAPGLLRNAQKGFTTYFSKPPKAPSQPKPPIGTALGQPAEPEQLGYWGSLKKGWQDHVQRVKDVQDAPPTTATHFKPISAPPPQVAPTDFSAFQKGNWTPQSYAVASGNNPLPEKTVKGIYNTAQSLYPTQGAQADAHLRQMRPATIKADAKSLPENAAGHYDPNDNLIILGEKKTPTVLAHELGHATQSESAYRLLNARGGYFNPDFPQLNEGALATAAFENEADDIGYQLLKIAKKMRVPGVTAKDVQAAWWNALTRTDEVYLPDALERLWKTLWHDPKEVAKLLGEKANQIVTNTHSSGFPRNTGRGSQLARAVTAIPTAVKGATKNGIRQGVEDHPVTTIGLGIPEVLAGGGTVVGGLYGTHQIGQQLAKLLWPYLYPGQQQDVQAGGYEE